MISRDRMIRQIEFIVRHHGTQQAAAKALGVSGVYLSDVRRGRREIGQKLLAALGYRRVVMYARLPIATAAIDLGPPREE
jgi:transcriptional regulator with XRE-family HTH domain